MSPSAAPSQRRAAPELAGRRRACAPPAAGPAFAGCGATFMYTRAFSCARPHRSGFRASRARCPCVVHAMRQQRLHDQSPNGRVLTAFTFTTSEERSAENRQALDFQMTAAPSTLCWYVTACWWCGLSDVNVPAPASTGRRSCARVHKCTFCDPSARSSGCEHTFQEPTWRAHRRRRGGKNGAAHAPR